MTGKTELEKVFHEAADCLGISDRVRGEVQLLASGFATVDLEGRGAFEDAIPSFDHETEELIKSKWETRVAVNPHMFAGPLASVKDLAVEDSVLKLKLQRSRFDIYDGLKERMPLRLNLTEKPLDRGLCLPLSMGAVTITAPDLRNPEGAIVFGIRSTSTAFGAGDSTTLPSGYFNPCTDRLQIGDPPSPTWLMSIRLTVLKELKEETNIQDYRQFDYLGLAYDGVMAKGVLIAVRLGLSVTVEELSKTMRDAGREVERYHFVANNPEKVKAFIAKHPPTPHDVAKLVLHFAAN